MMKREHKSLLTVLALSGSVLSACDRGDTVLQSSSVSAQTPDSYLQYVNTQATLSAATYTVVIATDQPGATGNYQLQVTRDDGTAELHTGQWSSSGGQDPTASGNPRVQVSLVNAGGIQLSLNSTVDNFLYLLDSNGSVLAQDNNSGEGTNALISLTASEIDSEVYAAAYYRAVDPNNERDTLAKFQSLNGFDQGADAHVLFRDTRDLGYGRDMFARRNADGTTAFYVNNYLVALIPGDTANYGPLNLDAALAGDQEYLIGTNAIEISPNPQNPSTNLVKFFTYNPDGTRATTADLDGRGSLSMPGMCFTCHGGRLLPLDENGNFQLEAPGNNSLANLSVLTPKLNQLEVSTFEFSEEVGSGYTRAELEAAFKIMNTYVHDSYQAIQNTSGNWDNSFAVELAEARYGGAGLPSDTYIDEFEAPTGWQENSSRPEGVSLLFRRVLEPHCLGCHALQGSERQSDINFSSYEKFIGHADQIVDYVYQRGVMPLSLRNYEQFWDSPTEEPTLLANFLLGTNQLSDSSRALLTSGAIQEAGRPVARAGADRRVTSPVSLNANSSQFASSFSWSISSMPNGAVASLSSNNTQETVLTADTNGVYTLSLTVSNVLGSNTDTVQITIDSNMSRSQTALTFETDIVPILNNRCVSCHSATPSDSTGIGVPVFYTSSDALYDDVMARVDRSDPENSRLLRKPTGNHHRGGTVFNETTTEYNTILNWIRGGAIER